MRLNEHLIDLPTLYHVIDRSPLTISPDSYVVDAIFLMNQERSNSLTLTSFNPSCNSNLWSHQTTSYVLVVEGGQLLGIFTERDIVRFTATGIDLSKARMAEVMTRQLITLTTTDAQDIFTAWSLLRQHRIRHLPIVDDGGHLLGIVTETNLLQAFDLVNMVGVVEGLQQNLQHPQAELSQENRQIDAVHCQTHNHFRQLVEADSVEALQINEELQQTLEELQVVEEELRQQNEELAVAREIVELERQRYQDLFEFAPDGYLVTDADGIIQETNHAAANLLSVRKKYLVGKPLVVFIAQSDRQSFITQLRNLQHLQHWETFLQPRDGVPFAASIRVAVVCDAQGKRIGCRWLLSNISEQQAALRERKRVEEALRQATEELENRVAERTAELSQANVLLQREITERQRAEEALQQSEKLYRQLVESQSDLIVRIDLQMRITFANTAACEAFGQQLDEFRGQSLFQFFHPDDMVEVMENMRLITLPPYRLTTDEQRASTVNGVRYFQWNVAAIRDETGEVVELQAVGRDVTDSRQMAAELRQSEEKFRHFAENIQAVIWIASSGSFQEAFYVSPAYEKIWGRSCQSLCDQPEKWIDTIHPDDRDRIFAKLQRHSLGEPSDVEYRILRPDGTVRWISDRGFAMRDEQGNLYFYGGIAEDITKRKQSEEALRQSEEKFRHFAENTHALIWIAELESGDNLYVNPAYEKIWERSCQSLRDQPNSWIDTVYPEDRDRLIVKLEQQKLGESTDLEYRILRPNGAVRWIWDRGFAIRDEQGNISAYGGIAEDITDRKQAEELLRESESRLSLALEAANMGIWDWNLLTQDKIWSPNVGTLYGLPSGTSCPSIEDFLNLINPQDREPFSQAVKRSIEQGVEFLIEYQAVWPDGSQHWLNGRGQVYYNDTGQPIRMIGTTRNISDRKQAEIALRESEELYRSVVTALREGILLVDTDGKIFACNTSAESILGLTAQQMIGNTPGKFLGSSIHEDGSPFDHDSYPVALTLQTGESYGNVVMGIYKPNGQLNWISINSQPLFHGNDPTLYGAVASFTDITEQQAALHERQQAEQKIREQAALLDIATDAIFVRDLQTQILFWNQGAERLYGWQAEEALGKNPNELFYPETSQQQEIASLQTVIKSGSWQGELQKITKSGQEIIVESRWTLMCNALGQPKSILTVDTDITERKQLQAQFFRAQRLESLGTLAGGIAHDLNNILTPIMAAAQLLKMRYSQHDERYQQLLTIIENNSKRGAALVKQVLSFARGFKGERTIVQVKHLIAEIIHIARQTFPRCIEFTTEIPEDLWAVTGDATQLHQVLMNLVVNARDAMPDGGTLRVCTENMYIDQAYAQMNLDAKVGHYIVITVADTGIGMPPEILDRIFEPFFTTKEVGKGTGLGLSTVLGIIKSHNGFVNVFSQVGKGTQFKLFLPSVEATQVLGTDDLEIVPGQGELILVVDDEVQIREIAKIILENHNYRSLTASNGIEAIALYAQHKYQISAVLMDMMMPEMDGITAIRTLQKMNPQVKIIAFSGLSSTELFTQSTGIQVQAFLSKPFTAKELLQNLNHILSAQS
ncbi:PAS domain S-box [Cylindrospermum stagnale PCC 7417]|uniref:histidine kinase n=1 Tax=Cylindrospermum stagnale PCC 7417 TaxID=56107 RepID=K9WWD6_9NOST|nr:PAS domain S-box protein [Cylindrospermum stagnale]AFZ24086.1 PAS domain S-box [Cylindrospermum stagnale PCC 7417]